MEAAREITVDERRRTSLAKIGSSDRRYLVEEFEDGTIVLTVPLE